MTRVSAGEDREPVIALRKVIVGSGPSAGCRHVIHPASRVQAACHVHMED